METNMQTLVQESVENLIRNTHRPQAESLIAFLQTSGFYDAHCHHHHHFAGGTSQHGLETLFYALDHCPSEIPHDSLVIACLLHDMCDVEGYHQYRGHGSRSCGLLMEEAGIQLTDDERLAILHHMHSAHRDRHKFGSDYHRVTSMPLWKLLRDADHYSAGHVMSRYQLADKLHALG